MQPATRIKPNVKPISKPTPKPRVFNAILLHRVPPNIKRNTQFKVERPPNSCARIRRGQIGALSETRIGHVTYVRGTGRSGDLNECLFCNGKLTTSVCSVPKHKRTEMERKQQSKARESTGAQNKNALGRTVNLRDHLELTSMIRLYTKSNTMKKLRCN